MFRLLWACGLTAALTFALTISLVAHGGLVAFASEAPAPPCPPPSYGADGNMGPIFCVIDNPVALRYFAPMAKHTFALGPDADPGQVVRALNADYVSAPTACSIYQLAAWRNQWHFGISPVEELRVERHLYSGWCPAPSFSLARVVPGG
jgi:hypothetical protein